MLRLRRPVLQSVLDGRAHGHVVQRRRPAATSRSAATTSLRVRGDDYLDAQVGGDRRRRRLERRDARRPKPRRRASGSAARGAGSPYNLATSRAPARDYRPELGFLPRRDYTTANVVANWFIFTDTHPILPPRLSRRARVLDVPQLRRRARVRAVRGLGPVGHEGRRRRLDRAEVVPRERARAVHDRRHGRRFRPGATTSRISRSTRHAVGREAANRRRLPRRHLLRRHARAGDPDADVERLAAPRAWGRLPAHDLRFETRGESADIQLARLRVRTALNARAFGNAFVQYNSTTDRLDFNVRLRYAFAEGTGPLARLQRGARYRPGTQSADGRLESPFSLARAPDTEIHTHSSVSEPCSRNPPCGHLPETAVEARVSGTRPFIVDRGWTTVRADTLA